MAKLNIPDAPSVLPAGLQAKWKDTYRKAYEEAQNDFPNDAIQQRQTALREANRLLRVTPPEDYRAAKALPKYQVHSSAELGGVLKLVTIDGKKYNFPIPKSEQKADDSPAGTAA